MKNTLEGINSRVTEAEERIINPENRLVEIKAPEQNKEKRMKRNGDSLRDLWDNIKCTNIHIIGVLEGEESDRFDPWVKKTPLEQEMAAHSSTHYRGPRRRRK